MEDSETYYWKKLVDNGSFIIDNSDAQTYPTSELSQGFSEVFLEILKDHQLPNYILKFIEKYQTTSIPLRISELIDVTIESNELSAYKLDFYLVASVFQERYIFHLDSPTDMRDSIMKDFQNEYSDKEKLLDILYDKLKYSETNTTAVSFKGKETRTINNHFVVSDLLNILIEYYKLDKDNFKDRKQSILENSNNLLLDKQDEYLKYLYSKGLYDFISKNRKGIKKNDKIRFVGQFLILSQIPITKKRFEIPTKMTLENLLDTDDIKYLNQFIFRPIEFFIKK